MRPQLVAVAATLAFVPAMAQAGSKMGPDFKAAFERTWKAGRTFGVVAQKGIPCTSVYGINGDQTDAHYSIDVKEGGWETSQGFLDTNQTAVDFLDKGEVMELAHVSFKDDRVDMRLVSVEAKKVTRGNVLFKSNKREPVATNFKFFFPFPAQNAADAQKALKFVEKWLRPYQSEDAARSASRSGAATAPVTADSVGGAPAPKAASGTTRKEIKVGMTPLEVMDILGKPQKELTFQNTIRWTYPDLQVLFENGRVKEVKF